MKTYILHSFLFLSTISFAHQKMKPGMWLGQLYTNDRLVVPFQLSVEKKGKTMIIVNGAEKIVMNQRTKKDSIFLSFPIQDAELVFKLSENLNQASGYWINHNKKSPVPIPLTLEWNVEKRFPMFVPTKPVEQLFDGTWDVIFQPGTNDEEKAVGIFKAENETGITGTFLTETGDYRYLAGNRSGLKFALSTFNGSWAMLFEAELFGDTLKGKFYSGGRATDWIAFKNPEAKLRNEASLTYVVNERPVSTTDMTLLNGKAFSLKSYHGQVIVFQIMGTWCPNCLDEVQFMNELYGLYADDGLEIIAMAYEVGSDSKQIRKKLVSFKKKIGMKYPLVYAGSASKKSASEQFPMLNGIMSFPTTIIMGKDGKIMHVHTGYSGPATGEAHKVLTDKIQLEIELALGLLK